jgi:hypothetical protein
MKDNKGHLCLKDFESLAEDPNWSKTDKLLEVIRVAAPKYTKEKEEATALQQRAIIKKSEDSKNSGGVSSSSKHEILIMKERGLKKPMIEPVDIPKKLRSVLQAQRDTSGFKNQNKYKNKEANPRRRSKLDMHTPPELPEEMKKCEILIMKERGLKKPMVEPVDIPKKLRSVLQAQRDTSSFKNQNKYKNKEANPRRRSKLDMHTPPELPEEMKKHEILILKERGLKKPMIEPVDIPKKLQSVLQAQRDTSGFKNQNKYKNKEANPRRRSKLDMHTPPELPEEMKKREILIMQERGLKKTMIEPVDILTKNRSVLQAQRDTSGFKYKNKEEHPRRRSKLDMHAPPELPEEMKKRIKEMGGTKVQMVIQKGLFKSDTKRNRVSMPFSQINNEFLTEAERKYLAEQNEIQVGFIDPATTREVKKMILGQSDVAKKSTGNTNSIYEMRQYWYNVCKDNDLRPMDVVQIWSFRHGPEQRLCLALVVCYRANQRGEEGQKQ